MKLQTAKDQGQLFANLYIGCQNRSGNLDEFFAHENQGWPPALSDRGNMRSGTKSDLVKCLESEVTEYQHDKDADATCIVMDGAVLVQMLKPGASKTFLDFSEKVFLPYLSRMLDKAVRLDLVWDQYFERSLKGSIRAERGKGVRRRVLPSVAFPPNWQQFLRSSDNKK